MWITATQAQTGKEYLIVFASSYEWLYFLIL